MNFVNTTVIFNNCIFFNKASLKLDNSKAFFYDCISHDGSITLASENSIRSSSFFINNNLIDKFNISYDNLHFVENNQLTYEGNCERYKILLMNLKQQLKDNSYANCDIDYHDFMRKNDPDIFNRSNLIFQYYYWDYSYKKFGVIRATLYLLLFFSIINFIFWSKITHTYLMEDMLGEVDFHNNKNLIIKSIRYCIIVIIYTSMIMFSIRIDKAKINYSSIRYLLLFFLEYLLGLISLLIIVNYFLKL